MRVSGRNKVILVWFAHCDSLIGGVFHHEYHFLHDYLKNNIEIMHADSFKKKYQLTNL